MPNPNQNPSQNPNQGQYDPKKGQQNKPGQYDPKRSRQGREDEDQNDQKNRDKNQSGNC